MIMPELTCRKAHACPHDSRALTTTKEGPALTKEGLTVMQQGSLKLTPPSPPNGSQTPFHFSAFPFQSLSPFLLPILTFPCFSTRYTNLLETLATLTKQTSRPTSTRYKMRRCCDHDLRRQTDSRPTLDCKSIADSRSNAGHHSGISQGTRTFRHRSHGDYRDARGRKRPRHDGKLVYVSVSRAARNSGVR